MRRRLAAILAATGILAAMLAAPIGAQEPGPSLVDPNLRLRTAVAGLELPTSIAFLGTDDLLVLEKDSGKVKRVVEGEETGTVLDLAVNNFSERGLLGITLHPNFPTNPAVYLFWSCRTQGPPADPFDAPAETCSDDLMFGADTNDVLAAPLLGNRIDRFTWNGATLDWAHRLITLRSFQNDGGPEPPDQDDDATGDHGAQPARGNHDGGIIEFGPDGKLYAIFGDVGRRGALQNLPCGPTATECPGDATPDDQFGGPEPDDAHFAGVILRLNPDGSAPTDNPFFAVGEEMGGEVGANLQKTFSYGIRNSFGMDFDPISGRLWQQENGEDAYDEINRVDPGMNSGWIQLAGPSSRVGEFREIETTSTHHEDFPNLQQFRWGPENIATTRSEALSRLFEVPGSHYSEPEFSWKYVLAPSAIGFQAGAALGPQYAGDLFMGFSTLDTLGGPLFRFNLTGNRRAIAVDDPRLNDRVADNVTFHEMTESESLLFGTDFGIVTDIETGPDGHLYVVSLLDGVIYEISRR
jgi:glucose/arabinose dehydrogenase